MTDEPEILIEEGQNGDGPYWLSDGDIFVPSLAALIERTNGVAFRVEQGKFKVSVDGYTFHDKPPGHLAAVK
jgi:hypothetical protein